MSVITWLVLQDERQRQQTSQISSAQVISQCEEGPKNGGNGNGADSTMTQSQ